METEVLFLANKLKEKCIPVLRFSIVSQINVHFFKDLFDCICLPLIEEGPILPPVENEKDFIQALLDFISFDLLQDVRLNIDAQKVISGDLAHILSLLKIFDNLYDCLSVHQSSVKSDERSQPKMAPKSKSVIYTPRTASYRMKRRKVVPRPKKKVISQKFQPSSVELLTRRVQFHKHFLARELDAQIQPCSSSSDPVKIALSSPAARKRDLVDFRRAKLSLINAKRTLKHKQIAVNRSKENIERIKENHRIRNEHLSQLAAEKMSQNWQEASKNAEIEFAAILREESRKKYKTVLDRIGQLEQKQRNKEQLLRKKYKLNDL